MENLSYAKFVADARKDETQYVLTERHDNYAIVRLNDPPSPSMKFSWLGQSAPACPGASSPSTLQAARRGSWSA